MIMIIIIDKVRERPYNKNKKSIHNKTKSHMEGIPMKDFMNKIYKVFSKRKVQNIHNICSSSSGDLSSYCMNEYNSLKKNNY